jgi:hypothetical protein
MWTMSTIRRDFVASHLRSQINRLRGILNNIENEDGIDCDYATESLKSIEEKLRQIRRICSEDQ